MFLWMLYIFSIICLIGLTYYLKGLTRDKKLERQLKRRIRTQFFSIVILVLTILGDYLIANDYIPIEVDRGIYLVSEVVLLGLVSVYLLLSSLYTLYCYRTEPFKFEDKDLGF